MQMDYAISTKDLTKEFGQLRAVDGVFLNVKQGEIFGLLGPNGAGKTTLISMLVTMKKPTSGSATVNGFNVATQPADVRKSIGIVFQDPSLDDELTAYENLELHAAMYGIEKGERDRRIKEVIAMVELTDKTNDQVKTFSGGMRRRLEIARGLIHYPNILFLDEPTIGLDPQTRVHVIEYVRKLKQSRGMTVVLTTHYLDEADSLADRIAIIDCGKIIALDTSEALKDSLGGDVVEVDTNAPKKLADALKSRKLMKKFRIEGNKLSLTVDQGERKIPRILSIAQGRSISVDSVSLHKPTLDDVFLHYTGHGIRAENGSAKEAMRIRRRAWGHRR